MNWKNRVGDRMRFFAVFSGMGEIASAARSPHRSPPHTLTGASP